MVIVDVRGKTTGQRGVCNPPCRRGVQEIGPGLLGSDEVNALVKFESPHHQAVVRRRWSGVILGLRAIRHTSRL